jgi:hypothetical protein
VFARRSVVDGALDLGDSLSVRYAEESCESLSTAGGMARKSVIGAPPGRPYPQTNGWSFWHYRDAASGELRSVDELLRQYLQQQV